MTTVETPGFAPFISIPLRGCLATGLEVALAEGSGLGKGGRKDRGTEGQARLNSGSCSDTSIMHIVEEA